MPFDDKGRFSWDGMHEGVLDKQKACETIAYQRGCWWIEECLIRNEDNQIIGRFMARTLISDARVPHWLDTIDLKIDDERSPV